MIKFIVAVLLAAAAVPAWAHHSFADHRKLFMGSNHDEKTPDK